jgi:hypothetical protein
MYREGNEGELNQESTCADVGEIKTQRNVLPRKTHLPPAGNSGCRVVVDAGKAR